jgi:uncharacterized membrane protein YeiH
MHGMHIGGAPVEVKRELPRWGGSAPGVPPLTPAPPRPAVTGCGVSGQVPVVDGPEAEADPPAGRMAHVEILAAVEALRVPAAIDLAAIVIGALTGGLLAAREGFAVSGVLLLAVSGGLGGGLIRDMLLGDLPPVALTNQAYLPAVAITAAVTFFFSGWLSRLTGLLVVLDAATLGLFTVIGAQKAQLAGLPSASVVFIGTVTAVGGAVIRDVLLAQRADIVQPGPYNAVAALIGAAALTVLAGPLNLDPLPVAAIVIVLVAGLRVLSVWRGWEAPVAVDLPGRARDRLVRRRSRGRP